MVNANALYPLWEYLEAWVHAHATMSAFIVFVIPTLTSILSAVARLQSVQAYAATHPRLQHAIVLVKAIGSDLTPAFKAFAGIVTGAPSVK
jgi:hypothetical protein